VRSSIPLPGNPWPHDMVITVDDDSQTLLELLWIREAWQLRPAGDDLPPALVDTPGLMHGTHGSAAPIEEWQDAWPGIWAAALHHAATLPDPDILDRLHDSDTGSEERGRLLRELVGPSWRDELGPEAMAEEAEQWMDARFVDRVGRAGRTVDEQPEHYALDALITAWRSGLTKIVEIPCRGTFTRRIGTHTILVTAETRGDRERYRTSLSEFR